jgi:PKD repeat protein
MGMTGSFTVVCTPPGTPNVSPGGLVSGCEGDSSVLLTVTADAGVDFQWNFNGIPIAGANSDHLLPDSSGVYSCTVTNDCGTANSNTASVTLSPSPTPSFTYTNADLNFTFTNTTLDTTLSWLWDFGDGATSTEKSPQHLFTAGHYTVRLTATDTAGNGCMGAATQEIDAGNTGISSVGSGTSAHLLIPNPATTFVNILVDDANLTLQVYDINGRLMQKPYITGKSKTAVRLDISMLPAGSYFVRIITKDNAVTKKLIIR